MPSKCNPITSCSIELIKVNAVEVFFLLLLLKLMVVGENVIQVHYLYNKVLMHLVTNLRSYYLYFILQPRSFCNFINVTEKFFFRWLAISDNVDNVGAVNNSIPSEVFRKSICNLKWFDKGLLGSFAMQSFTSIS